MKLIDENELPENEDFWDIPKKMKMKMEFVCCGIKKIQSKFFYFSL